MDKVAFGQKIRNLREDADLSQAALGKKLHMTQRKISYLECGKYEPSLSDIIAFCNFFHVSTDQLLGMPGLTTDQQ